MIEFRTTDRKRNFDARKDYSRDLVTLSLNKTDESTTNLRPSDSINAHLNSNYSQIRELIKQRKQLLVKKTDYLIQNNNQKRELIAVARDQDLKVISTNNLSELSPQLRRYEYNQALREFIKSEWAKDFTAKNFNQYDQSQRETGKAFWISHKQFERQMKKKAEIYANQSKQLKGVSQRERGIFLEIQRLESEMIGILTKARKDPNHIEKASKYNEEIQKRKNNLRQMKVEKTKLKKVIQDTIDNILQFNSKNEAYSKKRYQQLDQIFGGTPDLKAFDEFLHQLQTIVKQKHEDTTNQETYFASLKKLINDYELLNQEVEKFKDQQEQIFSKINEIYKENTKFAILQKVYLAGVSKKQDQYQLLKKCQAYRKLLSDLDNERPSISESLSKINHMSNMLGPIKKAYSTEDTRKQQLKKQLRQLCNYYNEIQQKQKSQRNFAFEMQKVIRVRQEIQNQLNDCAQKGNFAEYKKKAQKLQEIDRQIEKQRKDINGIDTKKLENQLCQQLQKLNQNYADIIEEIIVQDQKMYLGTYLNKLEKRLSLL